MQFFKDNSYDIVKLYVNQIGIAIFATVLYTAIGSMGDESFIRALNIVISIFSILFYCALLYNVSWEYGAKDKIRIDANKATFDKWKGLKMALIASVPNAVFSAFALLFGFIYMLSSLDFAAVISGVSNFFMRITMSMYNGIIQTVFGAFDGVSDSAFLGAAAVFLFVSVIGVAVVHIGYTFGSREYKIFGFISNKKDGKGI